MDDFDFKFKNAKVSALKQLYGDLKPEFQDGGSVTTPKRGLVDEPGSYAGKIPFTAKQQKIAEAYVEARGMTIENLTASQRKDIRDGMYTLETASETRLDKTKRAGKTRVLKALEESKI